MPLTGTSMAAPHVAGAVAVLQSEAQAKLARRLTPAEVRQALIDSATPMTAIDAFWDWPCGSPLFIDCGSHISGTTMKPYARWQVGAGYLNVKNALARVDALPAAAAAGTAPAGTAQPALPATPADSPPVQTTLPPVAGDGQARRQVHYARCLKQAARKQSRRTRARAKARCRALYG
jgi:subtilisin family serine protease